MFVVSGCVVGDGNGDVLIIHGMREYTSQFGIYRISEYLPTSVYQFTVVNSRSIQFDICHQRRRRRIYINVILENTEGSVENRQSRETVNIGYTRRRKTPHNMCWRPLYAKQTQKTEIRHEPSNKQMEVKNEPSIVFMRKS